MRCDTCKRGVAARRCEFPLRGAQAGKLCNRNLCEACAASRRGWTLCPPHLRMVLQGTAALPPASARASLLAACAAGELREPPAAVPLKAPAINRPPQAAAPPNAGVPPAEVASPEVAPPPPNNSQPPPGPSPAAVDDEPAPASPAATAPPGGDPDGVAEGGEPAAGVPAPTGVAAPAAESSEEMMDYFREMVRGCFDHDDTTLDARAAVVMLAPMAARSFDLARIASLTGEAPEFVETCALRLRENGIWLDGDGGPNWLCHWGSLFDAEAAAPPGTGTALLLDAMCAAGRLRRLWRRGQPTYVLAEAAAEAARPAPEIAVIRRCCRLATDLTCAFFVRRGRGAGQGCGRHLCPQHATVIAGLAYCARHAARQAGRPRPDQRWPDAVCAGCNGPVSTYPAARSRHDRKCSGRAATT